MSAIHTIAQSGFAEGTNDLYDAARPSYPPSALAHIHSLIPASAHARGLRVIEPGSGTGIFTRLLLAPPQGQGYPEWNIARLAAVEPSAGMRRAWDKGMERVPTPSCEAVAVDGGFDDLSQTGVDKADLIVIAQAWHWCPDHSKAFRELSRHLSPEGVLVFIWNLEDASVPWIARTRELYQQHDLGTPQYYRGLWRRGFEDPAYAELFQGPPEEKSFGWSWGITDQGVVDRIMSKSYMTETHLNGEPREQFLRDIQGVLDEAEGEKEYLDKENGVYRYNYHTDVVAMKLK